MEKVENQKEENQNVFENQAPEDQGPGNTELAQEGAPITPEMELSQEQALGVLIQAVRIGQKAGAYGIEDAEIISKAIRLFTKKE